MGRGADARSSDRVPVGAFDRDPIGYSSRMPKGAARAISPGTIDRRARPERWVGDG